MKLTIFIGSPKGEKSNSKTFMNYFIKGFMVKEGNACDVIFIKNLENLESAVQSFKKAERVLVAFPLYLDSMPAMVKSFIESLAPLCKDQDNPDIGFMLQQGFREALHSRYLERYLKKLAIRLRCEYLGTVINPSKRRFRKFYLYLLGKKFGVTGRLDSGFIRRISKPERFSKMGLLFFNFFSKRAIARSFNKILELNNAFEKRFDRPYENFTRRNRIVS
jgi:hypothetical protein